MPIQKRTTAIDNQVYSNYSIEPSQLNKVEYDQENQQKNLIASIEEAMKKDLFVSKFELGEKQKYSGSDVQIQTYENLENSDPVYARYIISQYGSYQNFLFVNQIQKNYDSVFDPRYDIKADITVFTKEKSYKSDHISPNEIIMEGLSGICTIDYLKKNGNSDRFVGTLNKNIIDSNKSSERVQFFSPLKGNRIVMWNLVKKDWSSFFVGGLIRFVRDDTIGIE
jgi:hypothetical protein